MKKKILIVSGDPNSINSELIFKTWKKLNKVDKKKIYLISNSNLLKKQFFKLKYSLSYPLIKYLMVCIISTSDRVIWLSAKFKFLKA